MAKLTVGLTGGLAAGKSTVAKWLADAGFLVVDADQIVAELYLPGGAGQKVVERLFGPDVLTSQGGVDHEKLARKIFSDSRSRHELEIEVHPMVKKRFTELSLDFPGIAILEATLLVEAGYANDFDLVVTVEASPETRLQRALERGLSEASVRSRLRAQNPASVRIDASDHVLWNDGDLDRLHREVDLLIARLRGRSKHD